MILWNDTVLQNPYFKNRDSGPLQGGDSGCNGGGSLYIEGFWLEIYKGVTREGLAEREEGGERKERERERERERGRERRDGGERREREREQERGEREERRRG